MSEKGKQNDPLLEESSALSDSPLEGICPSQDRFGQTVQVPAKYVLLHVSIRVCPSVCSLEMYV